MGALFRGSMSKLHQVAAFSCILIIDSQVLLISDDVGIFMINFALPNIWEDGRSVSGGWGYERTVVKFVLKYD